MIDSFVAIDVETANYEPTSICSIGAVKVEDGIVTDSFYELVKPEPEYYVRRFTQIHGISREDTDDARCFAHVWRDVEDFVGDLPLVAHNAAFDKKCLMSACRCYGIDWPGNPFYCTLVAARRAIPRGMISSYSLPYVCQFFGIPFSNHHNALADAEACAKIAIPLLK